MICYVDKEIRIVNCSIGVEGELKRILTFKNPEYYKKERMGKWLGNTPKHLYLYEKRNDTLVVPFGMFRQVFNLARAEDEFVNGFLFDQRNKIAYSSNIRLYGYQEPAVNKAVKMRQGVVVAPCGAGKTMIGLEIIARLGMKALWLTHTEDLLKQSMNRARSVYGLDPSQYGTITNGKVNIGSAVTFATVQTMCKLDLKKYEHEWDVIVVDECHHVCGTPTKIMMFYKVISSLCARYKYGLTATPKRTDGMEFCMYALIGDKVHEIDKSEVEDKTCPVQVVFRNTEFEPEYLDVLNEDGTINYNMLLDSLVECDARNNIIANDVANAEGTCLVLTDRVKHLEALSDRLSELNVSHETLRPATSKKGKQARQDSIRKLNNGEIKVLLATYQLAKEGLDVPSLKNVFFTTPQKNEITVTQSAGRVARKFDGKTHGVVYDYVDNFGMLLNYAKIRTRIYKRLEYVVA